MMSREQLEWYRRMTPAERIGLMLELMDLGWETLRRQGPEAVRKAVAAINAERTQSRAALLAGLERWDREHGTTTGT
ncbi:MAG: hypothetical protein HZA54_09610 [Planctomycetes bacterium]|nr:hypothetical protein [Planctomycetota bacterium]